MEEIRKFLNKVTWNKEDGFVYFSATLDHYTTYKKITNRDFHDDWMSLTVQDRDALIQEFAKI